MCARFFVKRPRFDAVRGKAQARNREVQRQEGNLPFYHHRQSDARAREYYSVEYKRD